MSSLNFADETLIAAEQMEANLPELVGEEGWVKIQDEYHLCRGIY